MSMFKEGRTNVKDDPRHGRPITATLEKDISIVKAIVDEDAIYTIEEISDISGVSGSYMFSILTEKLKFKKVCACLIPITSD
jgi:histone-lysine N-methyltransferase SETMAR